MAKPIFRYICPCGFRTNRSWRLRDHKIEHRNPPAPKSPVRQEGLPNLFPR
jgi:hypothetical protein